jgi:protein-S-isoprenylcysteine O-methyltransferase Ste14
MEQAPELTPGRKLVAAFELFAWPSLVVALSGDAGWLYGWIFVAWFLALCISCIVWLYRHDPALLVERFRKPGTGAQLGWDRYLFGVLLLLIAAWFVIMPLDAKRYHWTASWPDWARAVGALGMAGSSFFLFRSVTDNTYLSPLVRMQAEREHKLVSSGVYGIVRHPMYFGALLLMCGVPLFLGSGFGLVVGVLTVLTLIVRILGEERMLVRELAGYEQYRHQVRYRLVPGVW